MLRVVAILVLGIFYGISAISSQQLLASFQQVHIKTRRDSQDRQDHESKMTQVFRPETKVAGGAVGRVNAYLSLPVAKDGSTEGLISVMVGSLLADRERESSRRLDCERSWDERREGRERWDQQD